MGEKRTKKTISLSVWPFGKDDVAKLYWVDHPYRDNEGNWKMSVFFKKLPDNEIKRCEVDWGTLPILSIGRLYKSGKLLFNENEVLPEYYKYLNKNEDIFRFTNQRFISKNGTYEITTSDGIRHSVIRNAFVSQLNELSIHIPVIEMIRSILTKSRRLLYSILQPNSLDNYFILSQPKGPQHALIEFSRDYPTDLLTKNHIYHLLWLSTNDLAKKAWNEVYKSLFDQSNMGIYFTFPFIDDFEIKARFRQDGNVIRVEEILSVKGQKLGFKWVDVVSPHFAIHGNSSGEKNKKVIRVDENEIVIEPNASGTRRFEKIVDIPASESIFEEKPVINRLSYGTKTRNSSDETEKVVINVNELASAADTGGEKEFAGIEYRENKQETKKVEGDLGFFLSIIKAMESRYKGIKINILVDDLPEGNKGRKFHKLDDGVTKRKYSIVKIILENGNFINLIEIDRQGKSLSTLAIFYVKIFDEINMRSDITKILESLVDNNGIWDNTVLKNIKNDDIQIHRFHHTSMDRNVWELADKLYEKLLNLFSLGLQDN